ncbi:MAG: hypothetical protein ABJA81_08480 [Nocardioidaceae bacterium]
MAVAVVMDFKGATLEQYDRTIQEMGFKPGGPGAPGGLFHWITETGTGIMVTDVWETREQFDEFAQNQIGPITAQMGVPEPPELTFHDVHNYLSSGS